LLSRPDHEREVDGLRMIAVAALDFEQFVSAMKGIGDRWGRLIRAAQEQPSRPQVVIQPVSLGERPVSGCMGSRRRPCQAFMFALCLPQLGGVVSPVTAGQRDMEDSACAHPP
jgi:hypothetical protein